MGNKYRLGMYEKSMPNFLSIDEKLENCKKSGFDFLEISIDETDERLARLDYNDEKINEIRRSIEKTGVSIDTMCLSGHRKYPLGSMEHEKRSLEIMSKAIVFAKKLGVRIIQLAGYDVYYEKSDDETRNRFIKNLETAVLMASKEGIVLGFETMETPFMDTVEKAMEYVNYVDSPYLNVYPDVGNLTNASKVYGNDLCLDIKKGKGKIVAAHLKETIPNHYREIEFGKGHVDFVKCIDTLKMLKVNMFVGEFWYVGQDNWQEVCMETNLFLRDKLDKVFK